MYVRVRSNRGGEVVRAAIDEYVRLRGEKVRTDLHRRGWISSTDEVKKVRHDLDDRAAERNTREDRLEIRAIQRALAEFL